MMAPNQCATVASHGPPRGTASASGMSGPAFRGAPLGRRFPGVGGGVVGGAFLLRGGAVADEQDVAPAPAGFLVQGESLLARERA